MDVSISMSIIECCECHIQFAVSAEHAQALKRCHTTFYCPNGHGQSYVKIVMRQQRVSCIEKSIVPPDKEEVRRFI